MPKVKKAPKNAYYFFMVDRKKELERQGYRFPGGMQDVASTVRDEWNGLTATEKQFYEVQAKEQKELEKYNIKNKFTATGESYFDMNERMRAEQEQQISLEQAVKNVTFDSKIPPENVNYIVIKTIHSCEVLPPTPEFWPVELCIAAFNLKEGMKSNYWTLIDTKKTPVGYASSAKDTTEETALPQPGDKSVFQDNHRDYRKILTNVKLFTEKFYADYEGKYVLFAMDAADMKSAKGCLKWLHAHAELKKADEQPMEAFLNRVEFYELPKLLLKLAKIAKERNPLYNHVMAVRNDLVQAAVSVLKEGCFDFRDEITCDYHNLDEPSNKMHMCCRNIVLRRICIILKELVPAMDLKFGDGHDITKYRSKGKTMANPPAQPTPSTSRHGPSNEESSILASAWGKRA